MKKKKKRKNKSLIPLIALLLVLTLAIVSYFGYLSVSKTLYPLKFEEFVENYTEEYNLEKSFIYAVIKNESDFNPNAVSSADARGLMQLLPESFEWLQTKTGEKHSEDMLFEPEISIKYGCLLYRMLIDMFGSKETAVAAYHAGLGNVAKWLKNEEYSDDGIHLKKIPFATTEAYVKKVMKTEKIYNKLYKQEVLL